MIRADSAYAGALYFGGDGWWKVPYESAIERFWDIAPESAAPRVPEERVNAAVVPSE